MKNIKKNIINIDNIIFSLIVLFPLTTILQGLPFFNNINKLLMAIIMISLFLRIFKVRMKSFSFILMLITIDLYIVSVYLTGSKLENFNDLFYFLFWILYFIYLRDNYNILEYQIETKKQYILKIVILWNILVFVSLFFESSFTHVWGEASYFKSFSNGEHRFASSCLFIATLCFILVQLYKTRKILILLILPIVSIYLSGTRTYLAVIVLFIICIFYIMCKNKKNFYISIIPIIMFLAFLVSLTPMGEKFIITNQNGYLGYIGTITNGRSIFWKYDLEVFLKLPLLNKLIGNGFNFIYDINEVAINARIWAHNDYINMLINFGLIGLTTYIYVFYKFSKMCLKSLKLPKILVWGYYLIYFVNAMFNMVYVYTCSTLTIPFMLYTFVYKNKNNSYNNQLSIKN